MDALLVSGRLHLQAPVVCLAHSRLPACGSCTGSVLGVAVSLLLALSSAALLLDCCLYRVFPLLLPPLVALLHVCCLAPLV